ncbi:MAG: branched-chain amino acid ABC transporter permease [Sulfolobales archaeon]
MVFDSSVIVISIQYGLLYVLMALGLTMAYSIAKFANFAQGEYVMVSTYLTALISISLVSLPFIAMIFLSGAIGSLLALTSYIVFYRSMMRRGLSSNMLMIGSIGVMLIYQYSIWIFSDAYNTLYKPKFDPKRIPVSSGGVDLLSLIVGISVATVIILAYVYGKTDIGRASRAYADNSYLALISGVSESRVMIFMWLVAGFLAGVGGMLWAAYASQVTPNMGFENLLRMFAVAILGGMTSFYGTIAAGLIVGFAENYGIYVINKLFGVPIAYKPVIPFLIIIATLLVYPQGLGGVRLDRLRRFFGEISSKR